MNNITNSIKTASEEATKEKKEILETKEFSEGLAAIRGADGRWGFIDETGKIVVEPQYLSVTQFYQGISLVFSDTQRGGRWEVIDKTGTVLEYRSSHGDIDRSIYQYEQGEKSSIVTDEERDPDRAYWSDDFTFNTGERIWLGDGCSSYSGGGYESINEGYIPIKKGENP